MIYDSVKWKQELAKTLADFEIDLHYEGISYLKLEKFVFLSAFIIRKLYESKKLSDEISSTSMPGQKYKARNNSELRPLFYNEIDNLDKDYDLENGKPVRIGLLEYCNQVIHSYIFCLGPIEEDYTTDFQYYVNSDLTRNKSVFRFEKQDLINLIEGIIQDDIIYFMRDLNTGEEIRSRSRRKPRK